jgi:hypothetical protein
MKRIMPTIFCCLLASGCASLNLGRDLLPDRDIIAGTYNLIQVGGTFGSDAERMVILDIEGDDYSFQPVTGPGRIKNFPNVKGDKALQRAEEFFASHCAYRDYQIRKLIMPDNGLIGYELTPDYPSGLCEDGNEISVSYGKGKDGEIKVYTWLLLKVDGGEAAD